MCHLKNKYAQIYKHLLTYNKITQINTFQRANNYQSTNNLLNEYRDVLYIIVYNGKNFVDIVNSVCSYVLAVI